MSGELDLDEVVGLEGAPKQVLPSIGRARPRGRNGWSGERTRYPGRGCYFPACDLSRKANYRGRPPLREVPASLFSHSIRFSCRLLDRERWFRNSTTWVIFPSCIRGFDSVHPLYSAVAIGQGTSQPSARATQTHIKAMTDAPSRSSGRAKARRPLIVASSRRASRRPNSSASVTRAAEIAPDSVGCACGGSAVVVPLPPARGTFGRAFEAIAPSPLSLWAHRMMRARTVPLHSEQGPRFGSDRQAAYDARFAGADRRTWDVEGRHAAVQEI